MKKNWLVLLIALLLVTRLFYFVMNPKYDDSTLTKVGLDQKKDEKRTPTQVEPLNKTQEIKETVESQKEIERPKEDKREVYDPVSKQYYTLEAFNSLDKKTLMHFKGIGEKTAEAILNYRKETGPFMQFDELLKIKGIGEKKLASILLNSR